MFSGQAIERAYPVVERAARSLKDIERPTLNDLRTMLQNAWTAEHGMAAETQYLSRRGITAQLLWQEGKTRVAFGHRFIERSHGTAARLATAIHDQLV